MTIAICVAMAAIIIFFISRNNNQGLSKQNSAFISQGINPSKFIPSGKYLAGHTKLDNPISKTYIYPAEDSFKIYKLEDDLITKVYCSEILVSDIENVTIEDETTIQSRVGLKRLLALGVFAFALKKQEKLELAYLIIEWNQGKFKNETVFEFEGQYALTLANTLRNRIINKLTGNDADELSELDRTLLDYIAAGSKLMAVKTYKETTGVGLVEAKEYVDNLSLYKK